MTRQEYIRDLLTVYQVVHTLVNKDNYQVLHLRHRELKRDLVLRSFPTHIDAYRVLQQFQCNALPLVYDTVNLEDGQIVLEEYIDGVTIADMMEAERFSYNDAKRVITAVCHALSLLHQHYLVHRDVKPENVMIDKNGRVVLIDLNASRQFNENCKDTVIMGTVGYLAPEQLGIAQSDIRTDIYATGVLLNVMLTGRHPVEKIAEGKAGRIVRKCTGVNPGERYQSAEKLALAL